MQPIRIATRGSDLALVQARYTAGRLRDELGLESELVVVKTTGDRVQNVSLAKIGGKGLFVKEIEEALHDGRADVAVHSAKDLPVSLAAGLTLIAFPERADPRDALVAAQPGTTLATLREGARIGTGSTRRAAQLLSLRPDLEIVPLRGNVPTRIGKIDSEQLDAVVLACAGLDRLGLAEKISERISEDVLLPAVCQGTLALEVREGDPLTEPIQKLNEGRVSTCARAERAFLAELQGDCTTPLAVHAVFSDDDELWVRGLLCKLRGDSVLTDEAKGKASDAEKIGRAIARTILGAGGDQLLRELAAR